ncbi:hypothetical protein DFQ27_003748 [Actinomortierella ambigua]|uniref:Uncharacterized protein n=1 Tax=Actinomortierella ambigua TaxID=1343610 RepID=A0A9P6U569_9FUNG|nr:hypothetical protein DFQ27_003748 [Actinomortierella ambigua]
MKNSCKALANYTQSSNKLRAKPEEDGEIFKISGPTARNMFPNHIDFGGIFKEYDFVTHFTKCKPSPAYAQVQVKRGPYTQKTTTKTAYDLSVEVGFDLSLAELYWFLPLSVSAKTGFNRGSESVVSSGVEIEEDEFKQECIVSPGWHCDARVILRESNSGKMIVDDSSRKSAFFPATLNGKNLISNVWLDVPSA